MLWNKIKRVAQEEEEPWPDMIEFEPMPTCMDEYHSWRWKI